ncbi:MAG: trypsin-like peptidase domain-containing protein [Gemmatimonadota bacterium]|nr:trypsin-like peptidase domain-containing protein [Gemmatimonadota bacterium]
MPSISTRARWTTAVAIAFVGGVLLASGKEWTRLGFAQDRSSSIAGAGNIAPSEGFSAIADRATPAVVSIQVDTKTRAAPARARQQIPPGVLPPGMEQYFDFGQPQRPSVQEASGSGFIVTKDGYILTNNHVVTGMDHTTVADRINVKLLDGRVFAAKVVGNDPTTDVAVLKIDGSNLPTIPLGDDTKARVGDWVLAIGNPLGVLDFTVTAGIVSAKNRSLPGLLGNDRYAISDLIQTDAAINPGNSGGPMVNTRGEVIGINNAIASETGYYAGYGFAVPITLAKKVMDDIIAHGHVRFGVLGVAITEVDADAAAVAKLNHVYGVLVQGFNPDTPDNPARKAGLQEGDVITGADGQTVDRVSSLQRVVRNHAPGDVVHLQFVRYGKEMSADVRLAPRPTDSTTTTAMASPSVTKGVPGTKLGATLAPLPPPDQRPRGFPNHGVLVTDVVSLGPSYGAGKLAPGMVITDVLFPTPRRTINSVADLQGVLAGMKAGDYVSLNVAQPDGRGGAVSSVVNIRLGQ